ncbi:hypothetical protein [Haloarchaeobius iranensis]
MSEDFPSRCSDESAGSSWTYEFGTSAQVRYNSDCTVATDYDEIAGTGGFKRFQMQGHFSDPPDPYANSCDQEYGIPYQTGVEFFANQTGGTEQNQASMERVIESLPREAAGFGNCVQQYQRPARRSFGRRLLECGGYRDSTVVRVS